MRRGTLHRLRTDPVFVGAAAVAVTLVLLAVVYPLIDRSDPNASALLSRLQPPSWAGGEGGLMGTDELGRDLFLRILHGVRTSFFIAILAVALGAAVGSLVGLVAGYFGGLPDAVLMRFADVQLSFPGLLFVMTLVAILGRGAGVLILVLGLNSWMVYARVIRSSVLSIRSTELVTSSLSLGASTPRVLFAHVFPNTLAPFVSIAALEFARVMLAEASLSFLGFGVQSPQISLGAILASGRDFLHNQWWIATFAGVVLALAVLSTNLVGSQLQHATDPLAGRSKAKANPTAAQREVSL